MIQKLFPQDYAVSRWSGGTTTQLAIWPPEARYADRDFLWRVSSATVDLEESDFTLLPDYDRLIATLEGEIVLTHNGGGPLTLRPLEVHAFSGADATRSRGRCRDFNLMLRRGKVTGTMEALRLTDTPVNLNVGTSIACPPTVPACSAGNLPADPTQAICSAGNLPANPTHVLLYCVEGAAHIGAAKTSPACRGGGPASRPVEGCRPHSAPASQICHPERSAAEPKDPSYPSISLPSFTLAPGEALLYTETPPLSLSGPAVLMICRIAET